MLIQRDSQKQIVLYWVKQRDRILRNGYLVEAYLLWDGVSRGGLMGRSCELSRLLAQEKPRASSVNGYSGLLR